MLSESPFSIERGNNDTPTMYKNNSRHCSNFRGCSPHQRLFRLKSLHPAIGCYSCTHRCAPLANKKRGSRLFLDVLCHSETRHSPAGFSSLAATGFGTRSFGGIFNVCGWLAQLNSDFVWGKYTKSVRQILQAKRGGQLQRLVVWWKVGISWRRGMSPHRTGTFTVSLTWAGRSTHFRLTFDFCGDRKAG